MKFFLTIGIAYILTLHFNLAKAQQWKMQDVPIQSRWGEAVSPSNALNEYPRPQMVRAGWTNLNGLWEYAVTGKATAVSARWDGKILVPYPIESALSGVKKALLPEQLLWYKRSFEIKLVAGSRTLLHFGAVDYQCWVYVNGKEVGSHEGGYTEFSFDVTSFLKVGSNEVVVKVYDPSDAGHGPRGKQVLNPKDIYYTPSSGIWQTVWLEQVPEHFIERLTITPDVDLGVVSITAHSKSQQAVTLVLNGKKVVGESNMPMVVSVPNARLWSPASPYLYDFSLSMGKDVVKSYFGMRKIAVAKDAAGVDRIFLNNKPYYNLGTLDQGFWPEGLHTAPTDEALAFDIKAIKAMGFNTIRKHIKVEPARWYYHADKIGMLVWQDFVQPDFALKPGAKEIFEKQGAEMLAQLHNYPSIVTYVLFNEKWGQYDQERLTKWVKSVEPTRIVNGHSGEILYVNDKLRSPSPNAYVGADMTDIHAYPDPMISAAMPGKARVCGEFGGIGVFVPDHQWISGSAWGYINEKPAAFKAKYTVMNQHLKMFEAEGLSGSIYTQPFDVEGEQNGMMTYDREVIKIPFADLRKIHASLNPDVLSAGWMKGLESVSAKDADLTEPAAVYADAVAQYMSGNRDAGFLKKLTMMALQTKDLAGKARFGAEYLAKLSVPYSASDWEFIEGLTSKVTDKGFVLLLERAKSDRALYVKLMNMVYTDVIASYVPKADAKPNWDEVEAKVRPFGDVGEEIFLRAKTIHVYNQQDWAVYVPTASLYLKKYGAGLKESERDMFQKAVDEHQ